MFRAPEAVPRIVLTRPVVSSTSKRNALKSLMPGPDMVAPRYPTLPNSARRKPTAAPAATTTSKNVPQASEKSRLHSWLDSRKSGTAEACSIRCSCVDLLEEMIKIRNASTITESLKSLDALKDKIIVDAVGVFDTAAAKIGFV